MGCMEEEPTGTVEDTAEEVQKLLLRRDVKREVEEEPVGNPLLQIDAAEKWLNVVFEIHLIIRLESILVVELRHQ